MTHVSISTTTSFTAGDQHRYGGSGPCAHAIPERFRSAPGRPGDNRGYAPDAGRVPQETHAPHAAGARCAFPSRGRRDLASRRRRGTRPQPASPPQATPHTASSPRSPSAARSPQEFRQDLLVRGAICGTAPPFSETLLNRELLHIILDIGIVYLGEIAALQGLQTGRKVSPKHFQA